MCRLIRWASGARPRPLSLHGSDYLRTGARSHSLRLHLTPCGLAVDLLGRADPHRCVMDPSYHSTRIIWSNHPKKRAQRLRKETGNENIKAPIELEIKDIRHTITVVLTRPIRMICTEGKLRCQPLTSECCKQGSGLMQARQQLSFSPAYFCPWSIPYSSCSCRLSLSFSKVRAHCPGAKGARPVRH